jgi:hypothetical protein
MSLSTDIISLLRDEASLTLCRKSPDRVHKGVGAHSDSSQKNRLAKIDALQDWLQSALHAKLRDYLREESHEYRYSAKVLSAISTWEQGVNPYGDCLLAFASELKNAARALAGSRGDLYSSFNSRSKAMAGLLLSAGNLDRASLQLDAAAHHLGQVIAGTIYDHDEVRVLPPPFAGLVQWVENLELRANVEALVKMQNKEAEVRLLLVNKLLPLRSRATTAREAVTKAQEDYFENYWADLRLHALTHYVKDREVDEVLDELTERYLGAIPLDGRQFIPDEPALLYA